MLLRHPTIYLDHTGRTTDALLIRDGVVAAVGPAAVERHRDDEPVEEPEAACLFPGLTDAHAHLWGLGRRAGSVELSGADSWSELLAELRSVDLDDLPADWVLGRRWDEHGWPERPGDWRGDLDALFPDTPVCLHRVDHHAVICNSEALKRAGYTDGERESSGGELEGGLPAREEESSGGRAVRDADGRLTGLLVDEAMDPVLEAIPPSDRAEDRRMFRRAADRFLDYGVTCVHIARTEVDRLEMVRRMHADGELPLRMYLLVDGEDDDLPEVLAEGPTHDPAAELSVGGVKYFADGALGSGGALLEGSYADGESGLAVTSAEALREHAVELMEAGWQMAVHAIGDRAAHRVLEAYAAVDPEVRAEVRPRLEHAQMLTDADCARIGELSCVASIQPIHMYSDAAWADEVLDAEQLDRLFRWRELADRTVLAAGSDFPIEDPNPWHGIATALSRRDAAGRIFRGDQALTRSQILAAYTTGPAHAAHWEEKLGRLDPGYVADVIALDRDPFVEEPDSIWDTEVVGMWRSSGEAAKQRSGEAAKQRSGEAAKQRSGEA